MYKILKSGIVAYTHTVVYTCCFDELSCRKGHFSAPVQQGQRGQPPPLPPRCRRPWVREGWWRRQADSTCPVAFDDIITSFQTPISTVKSRDVWRPLGLLTKIQSYRRPSPGRFTAPSHSYITYGMGGRVLQRL